MPGAGAPYLWHGGAGSGFGGGLVAGSVMLLGGEPGIGKSTLLLQVAAAWPRTGS